MKKITIGMILLACILSFLHSSSDVKAKEISRGKYEVTLKNNKGNAIGKALLVQTNNGVLVQVKASGLDPGFHGIHFHEVGRCEGPDFSSAGGHFNPFQKEHGLKNPKGSHAGDLNNITADAQGIVNTTFITRRVTLKKGEKHSLFDLDGSALIIHAKADDQMSNPSGNSGDRVVCGVIKK